MTLLQHTSQQVERLMNTPKASLRPTPNPPQIDPLPLPDQRVLGTSIQALLTRGSNISRHAAPSTISKRKKGWKEWQLFLEQIDDQVDNFTEEEQIQAFMVWLLDRGVSPQGVAERVGAVNFAFAEKNQASALDSPQIKQLYKAIMRDKPVAKQKTAFELVHIVQILHYFTYGQGSLRPDAKYLVAAFTLAFYGVLRASEYSCPEAKQLQHWVESRALRRGDITFRRHNKVLMMTVTIRIRKNKNSHQFVLYGRKPGDPAFDPIPVIHQLWLQAQEEGPLLLQYTTRNGWGPLRCHTIRKLVKEAATRMNLDHTLYSSHSLRSGGACQLLILGFTIEEIMIFGGWESDAIRIYLQQVAIRGRDVMAHAPHQQDRARL